MQLSAQIFAENGHSMRPMMSAGVGHSWLRSIHMFPWPLRHYRPDRGGPRHQGRGDPLRTEHWDGLQRFLDNGRIEQAYFADLLTRLVNGGWRQKRIDELIPWNWQPDHPS
jgi:hypothetical protein